MSSDAASSRVLIPHNMQKIIEGIKEIIGNQHTDDEIYIVLKECSMDPDESTHKLLDLDNFQEVRRRRERNKEGFNSRASKDSRSKQVGQGRKGKDSGHESSTRPVSRKTRADVKPQATRVLAVVLSESGLSASKYSSTVSDGSIAENLKPQVADAPASCPVKIVDLVTSIDKGKSLSSADQVQAFPCYAPVSCVLSFSSDPILVQSIVQSPGANGVIDSKVEGQDIFDVDLPSPKNKESNEIQKNHLAEISLLLSSLNGSLKSPSPVSGTANASEASEASVKISSEWRQNVIFPKNFQVPEALKSGLTFGSFRNFNLIEISSGATGYDNNNSASLEYSQGNDGVITSGNQGTLAHGVFVVPYSINANFHHVSSPSQSPPTHQSSIVETPHPVAIFIQPYHHNFLPYSHYYQPMYVFPMHQYMGHNGIPQMVAGGNMYLSPQDASASHFGIPSGTFFTPTGNLGTSTINEDLNEDHTYATGQMGEDLAVWLPALCQGSSNMQVTPMHNFFPHGHATIYQEALEAASPSNLLEEPPQAETEPVEDERSPTNQQPEQHVHITWKPDFKA